MVVSPRYSMTFETAAEFQERSCSTTRLAFELASGVTVTVIPKGPSWRHLRVLCQSRAPFFQR